MTAHANPPFLYHNDTQDCPPGFTDTGLDCLKPAPYGRGASLLPPFLESDHDHLSPRCRHVHTSFVHLLSIRTASDDMLTAIRCYVTLRAGAGYFIWDQGTCEQQNPQGCEKWGLIWYPICRLAASCISVCLPSTFCLVLLKQLEATC